MDHADDRKHKTWRLATQFYDKVRTKLLKLSLFKNGQERMFLTANYFHLECSHCESYINKVNICI